MRQPTEQDLALGNEIKKEYPHLRYVRKDSMNYLGTWAFVNHPTKTKKAWDTDDHYSTYQQVGFIIKKLGLQSYVDAQNWETWGLDLSNDEVKRLD